MNTAREWGGITQSHGAASRDDAAAELLRQDGLDDADDLLQQLRDGLLDLAVAPVLEAVHLRRGDRRMTPSTRRRREKTRQWTWFFLSGAV